MNYPARGAMHRGAGEPETVDESTTSNSDFDPSEHKKQNPVLMENVVLRLLLCLLVGVSAGFALEKSKVSRWADIYFVFSGYSSSVYEPLHIRGQMIFKKVSMLKLLLAALSTGLFCLSMMAMLPFTHGIFWRVCNKYFIHISEKGLLSSIFGGLLLGIGMALSGGGIVFSFAQAAARIPNAEYTIGGVFIGTLIYGLYKPVLDKYIFVRNSSNPWAESAYFITAFPVVAMFGMSVFALELLIPWHLEVKKKDLLEGGFLERKAWAPHFSGLILGLLEAPIVLLLEELMCGLGCYSVLVSLPFRGPLRRLSTFFAKCQWGFHNWWQIFYIAGLMVGVYLSASISGTLADARGVPWNQALIGGIVMGFGAHTCGASVIGHGVTGMAFFSIVSFLSIASMFAGGLATAAFIKYNSDNLTPGVIS